MRYHIVYKTTNLANLSIYVGKHSCHRTDCDYMGSGKRLSLAICKYGIENFERENIAVFETEEEAYEEEARIVTPDFIARPDTYNIKCGGRGNRKKKFNGIYHTPFNEEPIRFLIDRLVKSGKDWNYISAFLNDIDVKFKNGALISPESVSRGYRDMNFLGLV